MLTNSHWFKYWGTMTKVRCFTSQNSNITKAQTVSEILQTSSLGKSIEFNGWIQTYRHHKKLSFIHLVNGNSSEYLQVVLPEERRPHNAQNLFQIGASVKVYGQVVKSVGPNQPYELNLDSFEILGDCDPLNYPLNTYNYAKDHLRSCMHIRTKHPNIAATLRLRSKLKKLIHDYFHEQDYVQIDTGILTTNDCEGGSEAFEASHYHSSALRTQIDAAPKVIHASQDCGTAVCEPDQNNEVSNTNKITLSKTHFFGEDATSYLTVSGQLHLEAANSGIARVYSFGPAFRADPSNSRFHLSEFYMLEAELAFIENLDDLLNNVENLVKFVLQKASDLGCISENAASCLNTEFHKMTYYESVVKLQKSGIYFISKPEWGRDLSKQHEMALTEMMGGPVFVTDWPIQIKPFYMLANSDEKTVACFDLLIPHVGELAGGSLREHRLKRLESRIDNENLNSLDWYLDLRRFGSVPHGGYGLGFERLLQFVLGIDNIKDTIPFPRYYNYLRM